MEKAHATNGGGYALVGWRAYGVAVLSILIGLGFVRALVPLTDDPHFAPLVGIVALLALTCGVGPSLAAIAVGWAGAALMTEPRWEPSFRDTAELMRWLLPLVVALLVVAVGRHLRRGGRVAIQRASDAEESSARDRGLQQLAGALSAAATPSEVAHALLSELPRLLGSAGGSLGLIEVDELVIVDPGEASPQPALQPGLRLPLSERAPITTAARTGEPAFARTRDEFERQYPDGARLATYAAGALAVPLRAGGDVVGSMGFPFTRAGAFDAAALALANVAASLGGQALERSMLYERERAMREGLERITRMAPRFAGESVEAVVSAVCAEARETFTADAAQVWTMVEGGMEVLCRDPPHEGFPPGTSVDLSEFPGLDDVIRTREPVFERDVLERATGAALERVRRTGTRSVLRVPVVVHETADRILALVWYRLVPEPTAETLALARRFGDHAGLALEQAERRRAQEQAARNARETRRLLDATAALAAATTPSAVARATLDVMSRELRSVAGSLVRLADGALEVVAATGFTERELEPWRRFELTADAPLCRAVSENEVVAYPSKAALARAHPELAASSRHESWLAVPVTAAGRPVGGIGLSFADPRELTPAEIEYVSAVGRQAGQALERATLLETELAARRAAERLQELSSKLSGALTPVEVAAAFLDETIRGVGADAGLLTMVDEESREHHVLDRRGFPDEIVDQQGVSQLVARPFAASLKRRRPTYRESTDGIASDGPEQADLVDLGGYRASAHLPLTAGGVQLGVAVLAWVEPTRIAARDRAFLEALAGQCALALDRARRYESERLVAETLQRSILPETLPSMEGVLVAARYLPGTSALDVGGDWFDTLTLPDGRLGFVVGDVVGKGVHAASTMAQLRNGMRALTLEDTTAAETVTKLNMLVDGYTDAPFVTLAYVTLDPSTREATLVSAGHLPPLVVSPDRRVDVLEAVGGLPLGVETNAVYEETRTTLEPGSIVVLYTDGLIERRTRSIDDGIALLVGAAARAPRDPDAFVDGLVNDLLGDEARGDDVAVLAVRLDPVPLRPLDVTLPSEPDSLRPLRDMVEGWLDRAGVPAVDSRDVLLAVWEAAANAIEHAGTGPSATVHVNVDLAGDRIRVEVGDTGRWQEPLHRPDRGLGLRLIEALMTGVEVARDEDGTTIVMERPLTREPARSHGSHASDD